MIDLTTTNEWQHRDLETGLVLPWYTKSFLDELVTWELKDKTVLEIGMGASSVWWDRKCKRLCGCDNNAEYIQALLSIISQRAWLFTLTDLDQFQKFIFDYRSADIIIIDCEPVEWRDTCVQMAVQWMKSGAKLIIDNWDQPSVWVPSDETREMLAPYQCKIYPQEGHKDWKTGVWTI